MVITVLKSKPAVRKADHLSRSSTCTGNGAGLMDYYSTHCSVINLCHQSLSLDVDLDLR